MSRLGFVVVALLLARTAAGDPPTPPAPLPPPPPPAPAAIPPILDPAHRHPKWLLLEVTPYAGTYVGRSSGSRFIAGGKAWLHLGGMFAVGADYGYVRLETGAPSPIPAESDPNAHYVAGEVALSNDVAMRLGKMLLEMDLFLTLGAGAARLQGAWEALGVVGGGVKFYTGLSWLALRLDVNTYLHNTALPSGDRVDADASVAFGVAFLLPPRAATW